MGSFCTGAKIQFFPDEEYLTKEEFKDNYPFDVPTVYIDGMSDIYSPQTAFSWLKDSVVLERGNIIIEYAQHFYMELLAEDENGNRIWIDGRTAPHEGCWGGHYLGQYRHAQSFTTTLYNLETLKKEEYVYKLSEENSVPMTEYEIRKYVNGNDPVTKKGK